MANFEIIRDLAEKRKMTLRNLSARVGITPGALHELIRKGSTNTSTMERVAKELGVPVSTFFDEEVHAGSDTTGRDITGGRSITPEKKGDAAKDEKIRLLQEIIAEKERLISVLLRTEQSSNIKP